MSPYISEKSLHHLRRDPNQPTGGNIIKEAEDFKEQKDKKMNRQKDNKLEIQYWIIGMQEREREETGKRNLLKYS